MIWQNPWAWLGLFTLAIPLLVHLLARRTARVLPFPTLRFLATSPLLATRRTKLTDVTLLIVRCAIVLAAVAALAQPYLLSAERAARRARAVTRVIVVDTSASMQRLFTDGTSARAAARRVAATEADGAASTIIETASLSQAFTDAAAWLETQSGRQEVVVLSDFQRGSLDSMALATLPAHAGIRLQRVAVAPDTVPLEYIVPHGDSETVARIQFGEESTSVEWWRRATPGEDALAFTHPDAITAAAVRRAVQRYGARRVPVERPITLSALTTAPATATTEPPALTAPWMSDVLTRLARDPLLDGYAADDGAVMVNASVTGDAGSERLVLSPSFAADDAASATMLIAVGRAASLAPPASELEPDIISDDVLRSWQREATASPRHARAGQHESDGRWLWLLALLLIGVESWLRRQQPPAAP